MSVTRIADLEMYIRKPHPFVVVVAHMKAEEAIEDSQMARI